MTWCWHKWSVWHDEGTIQKFDPEGSGQRPTSQQVIQFQRCTVCNKLKIRRVTV